jgi:hypothetical protein
MFTLCSARIKFTIQTTLDTQISISIQLGKHVTVYEIKKSLENQIHIFEPDHDWNITYIQDIPLGNPHMAWKEAMVGMKMESKTWGVPIMLMAKARAKKMDKSPTKPPPPLFKEIRGV